MYTVNCQHVTKRFRRALAPVAQLRRIPAAETVALDDITLTAKCAEVLTLLGPNGSGKTTLLKLIATMLIPDGGELTVCGSDTKRAPGAVRRCVGFAVSSERSFFPRLTAWENLDFFSALDDIPRGHRREVIESVLEQVGLEEKKDELVAAFSSGMNQRLGLARALLKQPSVLLLDEPSRSLDPAAATELWQLIRRTAHGGSTVVLATHSFEEASLVSDSVAILRDGKLISHEHVEGIQFQQLRAWYFSHFGVDERTLYAV